MSETQQVIRVTLSYLGTRFFGWAAQPNLRTVQGEVERILRILHKAEVPVVVAGRTDRGVHARGQVISYSGKNFSAATLNALLPEDISVCTSEVQNLGFHARYSARSRTYCYRILHSQIRSVWEEGRSLWWPRNLEFEQLVKCAELLVGTHNFQAFTPTVTDHVRMERRVYQAFWKKNGNTLEFWIEADSFMRHMNRVLVGTMLQVAGGKRTLESFAHLLAGMPRSAAGPTAQAHGLYLDHVTY